MKKYIPSILIMFALLVIWEISANSLNAAYILPSPTQIVNKIYELREPLFKIHLPATLYVTIVGILISTVLGVLLAILLDSSKLIERAIYPIIIATQTIPITALAPLFILWFGYGPWSKIIVTILITFFPITINVYDGFKSTKREMEELLKTYGASKWQVFLKLKLPSSLPYFFSAIKMAIPLSLIGAAIGEWLGAEKGLGYFSKRMMTMLDGAGVFAPIVILSLIAMISVFIITIFENKLLKWRKEL